jgi:hypothetical protein
MTRFNGKMGKARETFALGKQYWDVHIPDGNVHLKVDKCKFDVVLDPAHRFSLLGMPGSVSTDGGTGLDGGQKSAVVLVEALLARLRFMNKKNDLVGADSLFEAFDFNGDGGVSGITSVLCASRADTSCLYSYTAISTTLYTCVVRGDVISKKKKIRDVS